MLTGLIIVLIGVAILFEPRILVVFVSSLLILFGLGMMVTAWQFRRWRRHSESRFINWIVRF